MQSEENQLSDGVKKNTYINWQIKLIYYIKPERTLGLAYNKCQQSFISEMSKT